MSYSNERLKIEAHYAPVKGKATTTPFLPSNDSDKSVSSRIQWRDGCSHVINDIRPKGSTHPKENSESLKSDSNDKGKIASQTRKYGF
jgi:hypothetical protein